MPTDHGSCHPTRTKEFPRLTRSGNHTTLFVFFHGFDVCIPHACICVSILRCTELFSDNQQCPFAALTQQELECYYSTFPDDYYRDSIEEICQYVFIFLLAFTGSYSEGNLRAILMFLALQVRHVAPTGRNLARGSESPLLRAKFHPMGAKIRVFCIGPFLLLISFKNRST